MQKLKIVILLLLLSPSFGFAMKIAASSVAVYLFIIVAIRLFGKKELAQLSIIDLVFILLISNAVQNAMEVPRPRTELPPSRLIFRRLHCSHIQLLLSAVTGKIPCRPLSITALLVPLRHLLPDWSLFPIRPDKLICRQVHRVLIR